MTEHDKRQLIEAAIAEQPVSPRALEKNPPRPLSPTDVRVTVQAMLDDGTLALNDRLKLEKR